MIKKNKNLIYLDIFLEILYKIITSVGSVMKAFAFVKSVWSLPEVGMVKAVVPTVSGSGKSSGPYCEWEL